MEVAVSSFATASPNFPCSMSFAPFNSARGPGGAQPTIVMANATQSAILPTRKAELRPSSLHRKRIFQIEDGSLSDAPFPLIRGREDAIAGQVPTLSLRE